MNAQLALIAMSLLFVILVAFTFMVLWHIKAWGRPKPQRISDVRLSWCIYDMGSWIQHYHELSSEQKDKRVEQFQRNLSYWRELRLERLKRSTTQSNMDERYRKRALNKYIPIDTRALELLKSGFSEWEADKQAYDEWIQENSHIRFKGRGGSINKESQLD